MDRIKNSRKYKIIDTIEYNGHYTDVSTVRDKIIYTGSAIIIGICALIISLFIL